MSIDTIRKQSAICIQKWIRGVLIRKKLFNSHKRLGYVSSQVNQPDFLNNYSSFSIVENFFECTTIENLLMLVMKKATRSFLGTQPNAEIDQISQKNHSVSGTISHLSSQNKVLKNDEHTHYFKPEIHGAEVHPERSCYETNKPVIVSLKMYQCDSKQISEICTIKKENCKRKRFMQHINALIVILRASSSKTIRSASETNQNSINTKKSISRIGLAKNQSLIRNRGSPAPNSFKAKHPWRFPTIESIKKTSSESEPISVNSRRKSGYSRKPTPPAYKYPYTGSLPQTSLFDPSNKLIPTRPVSSFMYKRRPHSKQILNEPNL